MPYLSEIQHRRVIEPNGNGVGTLKDLVVVPTGQSPAIQWAIVSTGDGERVVRWSDVAQEIGHLRLRVRLESAPPVTLPAEALRLWRDLVDRQVVDTRGARLVTVSDVALSDVEGQLRLVGADVGPRGLLRRLGLEAIATRIAALARRALPDGTVPWQALERRD
jgi:sporulation protein YlmC with PRC-barrel domain